MYPLHRKAVLSEIRQRLDAGLACRVVSTSLIEAGVDVDFPTVYRAEAGLDSIIQAAGRCNREAKRLALGQVVVFRPSEEYRQHMPEMIRRGTGITESIFHQFSDVTSPEAISAFFSELYYISGDGIDAKRIVENLERGLEEDGNFPFAQIASGFHLIDNTTKSIIIPDTDEAQKLVQRLKSGERNRDLMRAVQQYSVNVYDRNYQAMYSAGQIQPLDAGLDEGIAVLTDDKKYDENTGLDADADSGNGIFI
jgi:CRISPR-associated endonuclease/helicase Cas3